MNESHPKTNLNESIITPGYENALKAKTEMLAFALQLGYRDVQSIEGLNLTKEEIEKIGAANFENIQRLDDPRRGLYLLGTHDSGAEVKILADSLTTTQEGGKFYAHFFSPANYQGHGFGNDFYNSEMKQNLESDLHNPIYPTSQ